MKNISKTDLCKELLMNNPKLTCKEIMKKVNCSDSVVYSARYELKKELEAKIRTKHEALHTNIRNATADKVLARSAKLIEEHLDRISPPEPAIRPTSYFTVSKSLSREDFLAFLRGSLIAAITSNNWTEIDEIVTWYLDARTAPTTCRS